MPIYAYKCTSCGHAKDVLQKMSDAPLAVCPACGEAQFQKQLTAAGFQLKGSGWYVTDFRNGQAAAAATGEAKGESKTDAKAGGEANGQKVDAAPASSPATATATATAPAPAAAAPAPASPAPAKPSSGSAS